MEPSMATEFNIPESQREFVDLRSDTVTRPTPEMYEAILKAPLGDDVLGDEPTVAELERLACEKMGMEAAVFVPSGTMGNQIAVPSYCQPGDAAIFEEDAHMLYYESGGPAALGGVLTWTLRSKLGVMDPDDIERHIIKRSIHSPGVTLICVENTHNRAGGTIVPQEMMAAYRQIADKHGIALHLDGARIFNAAAGLGIPAKEIARYADSVSFCLSKGLSSPVGSVLCGTTDFIERARQWRKRMGGAMRQAGILAACGIVSLTKMVDRLADDHRRARTMASALSELPGLRVDWDRVQTNMALVYVDDGASWMADLKDAGILCSLPAPTRIRLVFHADIGDEKLGRAIDGFRRVSERRSMIRA
jgi:threonine aldolase